MRTMDRLMTGEYRRLSQKTAIWVATLWGCLCPGLAIAGVPNGTWLSQPQIRFYSSTNTLGQVMKDIQSQNYKVVFLDFRGVSDEVQRRVSREAREYKLMPVVWVQSPLYRSLTVAGLIHEARPGDGIQVDDHFFAHYSEREFQSLDYQYRKPIFCSIQPFQANLVTGGRCNQLDVQCYATENFRNCIALAERLDAVVSLSEQDTFRYREQLGARPFNVFLWPYNYLPPTPRAKAVPKRGNLKSKISTFWIGVKVRSRPQPRFPTTSRCRDAERDNLGIVKQDLRSPNYLKLLQT